MKRVLVFVAALVIAVSLCSSFVFQASAETYSRDYPQVGNSGSTVWIDCNIQGYGRYCIVLPSTTPLNIFGFDAPTGYQLINNTNGTVSGYAYGVNGGQRYQCQWSAYDQLYFRVNTTGSYYSWQPVTITKINGTTLDIIDEIGDRQNDYYKGFAPASRELFAVVFVSVLIVMLIFILISHFRKRVL